LSAAIVVAILSGIAPRAAGVWGGILAVAGRRPTIPTLALLVFMIPLLASAPPRRWPRSPLQRSPIVRNTVSGLTGIPVRFSNRADVLGLSSTARLWKVELPLASPSILAASRPRRINVRTATPAPDSAPEGWDSRS